MGQSEMDVTPIYGTVGSNQHDRDILVKSSVFDSASSFEDMRICPDEGNRECDWGEVTFIGCFKDAVDLVGNATVADLNAIGVPGAGDTYVAIDTGTPTAGTSDALTAGDITEWDGTQWKKVVSNSGGFVPAKTAYKLSESVALVSPYTDGTDDGKIAVFDGTSNTGALKTTAAPESAPRTPCRDQADATTNATMSAWDITIRKLDGSGTPYTYDVQGGSFYVDADLAGVGNVTPLPVGEQWIHKIYALSGPDIPLSYGGQQPFFDGFMFPHQGKWIPETRVDVAKPIPAGVPIRVYWFYPNGAQNVCVAKFLHRRHAEI